MCVGRVFCCVFKPADLSLASSDDWFYYRRGRMGYNSCCAIAFYVGNANASCIQLESWGLCTWSHADCERRVGRKGKRPENTVDVWGCDVVLRELGRLKDTSILLDRPFSRHSRDERLFFYSTFKRRKAPPLLDVQEALGGSPTTRHSSDGRLSRGESRVLKGSKGQVLIKKRSPQVQEMM